MAEYRKYLFDNFVIGDDGTNTSDRSGIALDDQNLENVIPDNDLDTSDITATDIDQEISHDDYDAEDNHAYFTQDDIDDAAAKAKEEGYAQGILAAQESDVTKQNGLLNEIKNKLSDIFSDMASHNNEMELKSLQFLAAALHKLLPELEKVDNIPEIKQFLEDNFAHFSNEKSLVFFFHPDVIQQAAALLEKIAADSDFEGKITIHKDEKLGQADCRIEFKDGYVERNGSRLLNKLQDLLVNNQEERENG